MTMMNLGSSVRPIVTYVLVLGQIVLAFVWALGTWPEAKDAFSALSPFTSIAIGLYFKSRDELHTQDAVATATAVATGAPLPPKSTA